ncbi:MAG: hypothetical protein ACLPID_14535 [Beijerinckiaceae bacterium]
MSVPIRSLDAGAVFARERAAFKPVRRPSNRHVEWLQKYDNPAGQMLRGELVPVV